MDTPDSSGPTPAPNPTSSHPTSLEQVRRELHTLQARFEDHEKRNRSERAALEEHTLYLRKLIVGILIASLFLLGGTCLFFGKQMRLVRSQLEQHRPLILRTAQDFRGRLDPEIRRFAMQLQVFEGTHPDFRPILDRYRAVLPEYFSTLTPALPVAPVPVTPLNEPATP